MPELFGGVNSNSAAGAIANSSDGSDALVLGGNIELGSSIAYKVNFDKKVNYMCSKMKKITRYTLRIVIFLIILYLFLWLLPIISYSSEEVTEGDFYGLPIGMNRNEVYTELPRVLLKLDSNNIQFKLISILPNDATFSNFRVGDQLLVQTRLSDIEYEMFRNEDDWTIYFNGDFSKFLKLSFCQDKLCKVYYHIQYFELP